MALSKQDAQGVLSKQTEIDFGETPVAEAEFTVSDESVTVHSRMSGQISYEAPTGKDQDELTMDSIDLRFAPGDKSFTIYAKGREGYIADKFIVNYLIG